MNASLAPCPGCRRHVRVSDTACPFCTTALAPDAQQARVVPGAPAHLSRAAAIAALSTLAIAGCDNSRSAPAAVYGGPPMIAPTPSASGSARPDAPKPEAPKPGTSAGGGSAGSPGR